MRIILPFLSALLVTRFSLQAQLPTITSQPASRAMWMGGNARFGVVVSGAGPFTFQWQLNNTNLPNGIISTVAGGGVCDGTAATNASLNYPSGVAVDVAGNLFIADLSNNRVRKVNTNGVITTVAGSGQGGYSGDGGPATSASFRSPESVAMDTSGNLFIADEQNSRIRKVSANGIIITVAGNGNAGYSGDGGPATNASFVNPQSVAVDTSGNLYIADFVNDRIRKVSSSGIITTVAGNGVIGPGGGAYSGDGGPATNASLWYPSGVAVDASGNLFIADSFNNRVRKVNSSGIITTFAGNGNAGYSGDGGAATNAGLSPHSVTVDASGNLFIADSSSRRIRKVNTSGIITTVAGNGTNGYSGDGGTATNASLSPSGVAIDASGNLFIVEAQNNRIRKVNSSGIITTVVGGGIGEGVAATNATLAGPLGIAVDSLGNLFMAADNRIRNVTTNGLIATVAGNGTFAYSGDGGPATNASFNHTFDVALDTLGNLFIVDGNNGRIRKESTNGIITTVAGNGSGGFSGDGGAATNASLANPAGVAVDAVGNVFIADNANNRIRKVSTDGIITTVAGMGPGYPGGGGFSGDGGPATNANLYLPSGVAVDSSDNLFIADNLNGRIRKVNAGGVITTVAGGGTNNSIGDGIQATNAVLNRPTGIAVDTSGNLFIADGDNDGRFFEVSTNGIIRIAAGNGSLGYSGDGGPATNATLYYPWKSAVDAFGNVFIADSFNHRLRKVGNTQGPTLALNNVSAADAGNYRVVVTGPGGSVTSSVAALTVATAPLIYATVPNSDGSVTLSFVSRPGSTNMVTSATDLSPPVLWQPLSTNLAGADGDWQFTDPNAASHRTRFYRSLTQ